MQQFAVRANIITHQTPTTDFQSPFTERFTLRQSLLRQVVVARSVDGMLEFAVEVEPELAVEDRPSSRRLERVEDTLPVLGPTGCLLFFRSRVITGSCVPSSC
jgi:hypothetical protein